MTFASSDVAVCFKRIYQLIMKTNGVHVCAFSGEE